MSFVEFSSVWGSNLGQLHSASDWKRHTFNACYWGYNMRKWHRFRSFTPQKEVITLDGTCMELQSFAQAPEYVSTALGFIGFLQRSWHQVSTSDQSYRIPPAIHLWIQPYETNIRWQFALTGSKDLATAIAAGGELGVIAVATVDLVGLGPELLVHQGHATLVTQEAGLVPMLVFVGQVLKQTSLPDVDGCELWE
jgi:hypothetical protein